MKAIYSEPFTHLARRAMNEKTLDRPIGRWLLIRTAALVVVVTVNFAVNVFGFVMAGVHFPDQRPRPPLSEIFLMGSFPAVAWVVLSVPVQFATRRLVRERIPAAVVGHIVVLVGFLISVSMITISLRLAAGLARPGLAFLEQVERHVVGLLPMNLLIYAALVAGTLAWDNWRLSVHRERTAAHLATELTRAELAALRSKVQPHFLFNALHGISSVMDSDVERARRMMVALSQLLRTSLSAGGDSVVPLEQELQLARDYLGLQQMRFEDRLEYDLDVHARPDVRVPSFMLQPLVENAVIHGMADRSEPTRVQVTVREVANDVEIVVRDNGPGFPKQVLAGTQPLGVGLGALRARLHQMAGRGAMTLQNHGEGGAQVILRVPADGPDTSNA